MTKNKQFLLLLIFCFCFFKLTAQTSIKTITQLQDTINKILANEHQSALMLAVVTNDTVLLSKGFGMANIDTK